MNVGRFLILLLVIGLPACDDTATSPDPRMVTGTITYRERIALPKNAIVNVQLQDVSLQDVAATVIAETTITTPGQVPIPFEISYDQSGIVPQNTYAIRATITVDGVLWFTNTTAYPVITQGNPSHVDMVLTFVRGGQ